MESYRDFARVYDEFMDQTPYDEWLLNILNIFKEYKIDKDTQVLDLGCGTGKMARKLAREGYQVTAVDNSMDMLEIAASEEDDHILYVLQDMVSLELPQQVDAAVSICDCMNYILEEEDLKEAFRRVREFLKEDGVFVFDMNSHYKYKEILACNTFAEDREDASFIWDNFYDEEERINEYQLSLFIQNEQGTYNKYEELHLQKAYEQEEVVSFLYEAGFSSVRVLDAETMDEVKEDTQRLYYICKLKGKKMNDYIIRGTAANDQVRFFAAYTKDVVETARQKHNTSPVATAALGRLLTAGAMMGSMCKNDSDVITLQIQCSGPIGGLTVTADSKANVKGYVNNPDVMLPPSKEGKLDVGKALDLGVLTVIKDIGLKEPYSGQTHLVSGEIAEDLTYYFAASEQIPTSVALGVLMNKDNTVRQAGGFIIQMMPYAEEETISKLEKKIAEFKSVTYALEHEHTPEKMMEDLLGDMDMKIYEKVPTQFHCNCSKERVEKAVISVGKKEIQNMIDDGEPIEVNCHFCNTHYHYSVDDLKRMLNEATR